MKPKKIQKPISGKPRLRLMEMEREKISAIHMNPGTLGYILVIEVLKTKDLPDTRIPGTSSQHFSVNLLLFILL